MTLNISKTLPLLLRVVDPWLQLNCCISCSCIVAEVAVALLHQLQLHSCISCSFTVAVALLQQLQLHCCISCNREFYFDGSRFSCGLCYRLLAVRIHIQLLAVDRCGGIIHIRRINTEEKAKVVAAVGGQNLLNSLPRQLFCTGPN